MSFTNKFITVERLCKCVCDKGGGVKKPSKSVCMSAKSNLIGWLGAD